MWWFGIKFVVDKKLNNEMSDYYAHLFKRRKAAREVWHKGANGKLAVNH